MLTGSIVAADGKRARTRVGRPYRVITRGPNGRTRAEDCTDVHTFKARLVSIAAENEVVSFDEIIDALDAS